MVFYRETLSEVSETASDLFAEARAELEQARELGAEASAVGAGCRTDPKEHIAAG